LLAQIGTNPVNFAPLSFCKVQNLM